MTEYMDDLTEESCSFVLLNQPVARSSRPPPTVPALSSKKERYEPR